MKKFLIFTVILIIAVIGLIGQEQKKDDKVMMEKWMKYATPNENHKALEYFVGKWDLDSKMWMKPGDKPMESKGSSVSKMILGGRYLKSKMNGKAMGMPFEGFSITGFDNLHKKYTGYWIDSTGTGFFPFTGTLDKSGKIRTDYGEWDDFMTGGKTKVKMVTTILNRDSYKFEMFMIMADGKEFKSNHILYHRIPCKNGKK